MQAAAQPPRATGLRRAARAPEPGLPMRNSGSFVPGRGKGSGFLGRRRDAHVGAAAGSPGPGEPHLPSAGHRRCSPLFSRRRFQVRKSYLPLTENTAQESKEPERRGARPVRERGAEEKPLPSIHAGPLPSVPPARLPLAGEPRSPAAGSGTVRITHPAPRTNQKV